MSEADWWLCEACQSLNNLAARKCYSCRRRKPKRAARASQHLGYRAVVSWDGKVRLEDAAPPPPEYRVQEAAKRPPPLREPVSRSIVEVAPPPPQGARITYWLGDPARDPRRRPADLPLSPRPMVAVPIQAGTPPLQPRPMVAVPIVPSAPSFPHWRELLDVPPPTRDPARLRQALGSASRGHSQVKRAGSIDVFDAANSAPPESPSASEPFVAWPAADLASRHSEP